MLMLPFPFPFPLPLPLPASFFPSLSRLPRARALLLSIKNQLESTSRDIVSIFGFGFALGGCRVAVDPYQNMRRIMMVVVMVWHGQRQLQWQLSSSLEKLSSPN